MKDDNNRNKENRSAEAVITGKQAVALAYDPAKPDLPQITAKGEGELARELIRFALENHVPIKYDPDLVQILSRLDVGSAIPDEVYLVVAEVLAFIYGVNQEYFALMFRPPRAVFPTNRINID
ncbi:MAG: EscU/YscU/HrcU family type III secretion system export apparatus switch protein [Deltaproteobacteria bacterium]|nr:EscU/YscU/HrcU family type III secretion system export apparatus switch protein [Deltaproteobacteria bacterium]